MKFKNLSAAPQTVEAADAKRLRGKEVNMEERYYDLVFIVRPATPEEEIKKILGVVEHACQ